MLFSCPYCSYKSTVDFHIDNHVTYYHNEKINEYNQLKIRKNNINNKPIDTKNYFRKECTCRGVNPDCFKCDGRGYIKVTSDYNKLMKLMPLQKPKNWFSSNNLSSRYYNNTAVR